MNTHLPDIATEADVKLLVDTFYDKVNEDSLLAPVFNQFAQVDWDKHLPIMYRFWSSILLGTASYEGQPFAKHAFLPVNETHFARWLFLFFQNLDQHFSGPVTLEAKARATNIARIFEHKIRVIQGQEPVIPVLRKPE